jgi:hypothetical protein
MARVRITPALAPTPRLTPWVPALLAGALSLVFLGVLAVV